MGKQNQHYADEMMNDKIEGRGTPKGALSLVNYIAQILIFWLILLYQKGINKHSFV